MWRYLGRRLIQVPLVLLVVSLMTFLITRATPGDPVQIMLGMQTSPEAAAAMRAEFNLDRPLPDAIRLVGRQGGDRRPRPLDPAQRSGDRAAGRALSGQPAARRRRP